MDHQLIGESRRLVIAAMAAQAARTDGWQQHQSSIWWQSGLPASGANLVLDCGRNPHDRALSRLSRLMCWTGNPVGWLVWPDQDPELQQGVLSKVGYRLSEPLWLGVLHHHQELFSCASPTDLETIDVLLPHQRVEYCTYLEHCHHLHPRYAQLIANTFLIPLYPSSFKTLVIWRDGVVVAAITASFWPPSTVQPTLGQLLWLGVLPRWRRQGLARSLTHQACLWLLGMGVERIHVQSSVMATGLYRSLGFSDLGYVDLWGWH